MEQPPTTFGLVVPSPCCFFDPGQVNFGSGAATGTLFLSAVTGTATTAGAGLTGITFVTVSAASITALG